MPPSDQLAPLRRCTADSKQRRRLQAYSTPHWFRDDWLKRFYDERQPQRATPAVAAVATEPAAPAAVAAQLCSGPQPVGSEQKRMPWQQMDNPLASSDYRFVYLGVKVRPGRCPFPLSTGANPSRGA